MTDLLAGGHRPAATRWREELQEWAIPAHIIEAAPESPWGFPPELFARRAELAKSEVPFSGLRALEALPVHGAVLDVGCGAGAASAPLICRPQSAVRGHGCGPLAMI